MTDPTAGIEKILTPAGVQRWMDAPIPRLGNATPREALAAGRADEVRALVASYRHPSFH
jgi:hypothetical protein